MIIIHKIFNTFKFYKIFSKKIFSLQQKNVNPIIFIFFYCIKRNYYHKKVLLILKFLKWVVAQVGISIKKERL